MDGWVHLPRLIDKIRLHIAGKLPADYQENLLKKGFDAFWLTSAGVREEEFVDVVKASITDGEVYDWVRTHVKKSEDEKRAFKEFVFNRGNDSDESRARLALRKKEIGATHRDDIKCFVDFIDLDEGRIARD